MIKKTVCMAIFFSGLFLFAGCDDGGTEAKPTIGSINSPAVGTKFLAGDAIAIKWTGDATAVKVTGSSTGQTYNDLTPTAMAAGTVTITAPETLSDTYTIKLQNKDNESEVVSLVVAVKAIILETPLTGQSFTQGTDVTVSWRARDDLVTGVLTRVSSNNGSCSILLNVGAQTPVEEDFTWKVGQEPQSATCTLQYPSTAVIVRIEDYLNASGAGMNDVSGALSVN